MPGIWFNPSEQTASSASGTPDYAKALREGFQTAYTPQMMQAQIQGLKNKGLKDRMLAQLYDTVLGGGNLGGEQGGGIQDQQGGMIQGTSQNKLGISPQELFRAMFHLPQQSPQAKQEMDLDTNLRKLGQKNTFQSGPANEARESLQSKVSMPQEYSGLGGSAQMMADLIKYNSTKDPEAGKRLVQAAVSERLVPEYAGFQLMSQGQKATVPALEHQTNAIRQGWPMASHKITNNLPPELQKEAERLHNEAVRDVNRTRESFNTKGNRASQDKESRRESGKKYTWSHINDVAEKHNMSPNEIIDDLAKQSGMEVKDFIEKYIDVGSE